MGSIVSSQSSENLEPPQWAGQFEAIKLQKAELKRFRQFFDALRSKNAIGKLEMRHFLRDMGVEQRPFIFKMFSLFRQASMFERFTDFRDFAFSLWNFCTLDEHEIGRYLQILSPSYLFFVLLSASFSFSIYDKSKRYGI